MEALDEGPGVGEDGGEGDGLGEADDGCGGELDGILGQVMGNWEVVSRHWHTYRGETAERWGRHRGRAGFSVREPWLQGLAT